MFEPRARRRVRAGASVCFVLWGCASDGNEPSSGTPSTGSGGSSSGGFPNAGAFAASGSSNTGGGGAPSAAGGAPAGGRSGPGGSGAAGSGGTSLASGGKAVTAGGSSGTGAVTSSAGTSGSPGSSGSSGSTGTPSGGASGAGGGAGGASAGTAGGSSVKGCNWAGSEGKTVLFDGTSLDQWQATSGGKAAPWRLDAAEKVVEVVPGQGNIQSKAEFESLCLHIEYLTPMYPPSVTGQERGNSGIYLKRSYEMQVLDSAGQPAAINTCGAVYGVRAPLVVACNEQLVWNTYEIEFKASAWTGNDKTSNAVIVSATLNGQLVQQNVELDLNSTEAGQPDAPGPRPLMLQDHNNPVRFRNIWVKVPSY
jgi:hypothetical protein